MVPDLNLENNKTWAFLRRALLYVVTLYILFILCQVISANLHLKKQIDSLNAQNSQITAQNQNLQNLIVYYQSDSFKELEAREKLGLKLPDEKVVMVPIKNYQQDVASTDQTATGAQNSTSDKKIANWQAWWQYIFD